VAKWQVSSEFGCLKGWPVLNHCALALRRVTHTRDALSLSLSLSLARSLALFFQSVRQTDKLNNVWKRNVRINAIILTVFRVLLPN
jgi:hypothetical protein